MELAFGILGTLITVLSFAYALKTQHDQHRLERLIRCKSAGIAGSIVLIRNNPALAHKNIDYVPKRFDMVEPAREQKAMVNRLAWAQGDSAAAHRLLELLLVDVVTLQQGLFGTKVAIGPDGAPISIDLPHSVDSVASECSESES